MVEIISQNKVKARKRHICNYCGLHIEKDEIYTYSVLKYDYIYIWKNHLRCSEIANKLCMFEECDEGVTYEYFHEIVQEKYMDLNSERLGDKYFIIPSFKDQLDFICDYFKSIEK